ncbi:septal ring lytic transglycosylase RlpA family protein [Bradyrhizobium sp. 2]|uniref:septal ring lytic transglycosylase RlpA family protein n=1 Tax=Bradyrhizobium sp. 2 TaxID=190045 RepID=UPI001FF9B0A8|nr:septal ring lytic transglycosylase RlpA family protein [Bradyrhizobium sp. 2]MCK1460883.1 septal ring lytic transglycosylase RlpA family protein [Bradyrhizobium sp. 2]
MKTAFAAALALACFVSSAAAAEICEASQYGVGDGYHGRRTASGARFNTFARSPFTIAHKTLPFGREVTITNLANGRGRCVDLGRAGADALGMGGTARVSVQ